jgi:hypothetical protein
LLLRASRDVPGALPLPCVLPIDLSESLAFFPLVPATFITPQEFLASVAATTKT